MINEAFFVNKRGGISFSGRNLNSAQQGGIPPRIPLSGRNSAQARRNSGRNFWAEFATKTPYFVGLLFVRLLWDF